MDKDIKTCSINCSKYLRHDNFADLCKMFPDEILAFPYKYSSSNIGEPCKYGLHIDEFENSVSNLEKDVKKD
jgi:hypothetical protein